MTDNDLNKLDADSLEASETGVGAQKATTESDIVDGLKEDSTGFGTEVVPGFKDNINVFGEEVIRIFGGSNRVFLDKKGIAREYNKISILDKSLEPRGEPEIAITYLPDGRLNVHLNPYDVYDRFYFIAKNVTVEEFILEVDVIKKAVKTGILPVNTIFERKDYIDPQSFNPADYV